MKRLLSFLDDILPLERAPKRRRLDEEVRDELSDLPVEMRGIIMGQLSLRSQLRLAQASRLLKRDIDRSFLTVFKREILDPMLTFEYKKGPGNYWAHKPAILMLTEDDLRPTGDPAKAEKQKLKLANLSKNIIGAVISQFLSMLETGPFAMAFSRHAPITSQHLLTLSDKKDEAALLITIRTTPDTFPAIDVGFGYSETTTSAFRSATAPLIAMLPTLVNEHLVPAHQLSFARKWLRNFFNGLFMDFSTRLVLLSCLYRGEERELGSYCGLITHGDSWPMPADEDVAFDFETKTSPFVSS